jgi:hypothetical protein
MVNQQPVYPPAGGGGRTQQDKQDMRDDVKDRKQDHRDDVRDRKDDMRDNKN